MARLRVAKACYRLAEAPAGNAMAAILGDPALMHTDIASCQSIQCFQPVLERSRTQTNNYTRLALLLRVCTSGCRFFISHVEDGQFIAQAHLLAGAVFPDSVHKLESICSARPIFNMHIGNSPSPQDGDGSDDLWGLLLCWSNGNAPLGNQWNAKLCMG